MIDRRLNRNQTYTQLEGEYGTTKKKEEPDTPKVDKPSYSPNYYGNIGSFKPSAAYKQAMDYTNSLLEKINSGKTSYSDKINNLMSQIENREKFSYDFNTDPLFQNALQGAMSAGQTAMQDTMGQAASLTGGYGSSYATSAANQAYNQFVKEAYDSLPDYYNLAKSAYDQEGQELYDRLGMYRTADESEYSRLNNAYGLNLNKAESLYNKEYSNYWDTNNYNLKVKEANNDLAYKMASFAENQRQYDQDFNEKVRQYNLNLEEEQRQFNEKQSSSSTNETAKKTPTQSMMEKALKIYNEQGEDAYSQYLDTIPDEYDITPISDLINERGRLPISQRTWTNVEDTVNWMWGLDNNDRVRDQYDEAEYSLAELAKIYAEELNISESEAKKMLRQYNGLK